MVLLKIKNRDKKECWAERHKDSDLSDFIEIKPLKEEKGNNIAKKDNSGIERQEKG